MPFWRMTQTSPLGATATSRMFRFVWRSPSPRTRTRRGLTSSTSRSTPGRMSLRTSGDADADEPTAGNVSSPCCVNTPLSRKPPNSATMTPARTNLVAAEHGLEPPGEWRQVASLLGRR